MKLGTWHHRPGGKWRVEVWGVWLCAYAWAAQVGDCYDDGYAPWAWLARRRAIAALRRMRTTQGGQ